MASTWMITLFHLWMEYSLPPEINKRFHIVDPLWVQLEGQSDKVEDILTRVPEREYVFIPILHEGHWVLWMKMRQTPTGLDAKVRSPIIFCDPLNNHPTTRVRTLGDLAIRHISSRTHDHCIINDGQFHELRIPTQPNGTDCGYYVMQTIRMLVEELIQGFESDQFVSIYEIWIWAFVFVFVDGIFNCRVRSNGLDSKTWSSFGKSWQNGHEGLWAYDYVESFCNGCIWLNVNHFGCIWISFWL